MKRKILTLLMVALCTVTYAQQAYDENIDPIQQIDKAVSAARASKKNVICQVGGNWCPWCLRLIDHIAADSLLSKTIDDNYIYTRQLQSTQEIRQHIFTSGRCTYEASWSAIPFRISCPCST